MISDHDHRSLAKRLDLFHFQEEAPGMVFWHPRGFLLYRLLEEAAREQVASQKYEEVRTPQVLRRPIWEASGHWEHFRAGMFQVADENIEAAIKPVSCPGHVQIVKSAAPSYRDLPIRLAEFGQVHRDEPGGTLHGLLRLRQFTQDDGHVFCTESQAESEVEAFCRSVGPFYAAFGFPEVEFALSTRPAARAGDDASWDRSEAILASALRRLPVPFVVQEGAGAFYGPKIEFALRDRAGRSWQCGTIQLDLVMPRRFDLRYVNEHGERVPLVMLHRALYGSLERFLGMLLEHHGAALPPWLAPVQVVVLPVAPAQRERAEELRRAFAAVGLRSAVDRRDESLARRVAEAHESAVPLLAVVGGREVLDGSITIRSREGQETWALEAALRELQARCARPPFGALPKGNDGACCSCVTMAPPATTITPERAG